MPAESERIQYMSVTLAFAVAAADGKMPKSETDIIEEWAARNITDISNDRNFHRAITRTKEFFHAGNKIDSHSMCAEIAATATLAKRYDLLQLCMRIAAATGIATAKELVMIRNLSVWLELDAGKCRTILESNVPVNIHEVRDIEFILGINSETPIDDIQQKLNSEYKKWNNRVTHADAKVRSQAQIMIELITKARNKYLNPILTGA